MDYIHSLIATENGSTAEQTNRHQHHYSATISVSPVFQVFCASHYSYYCYFYAVFFISFSRCRILQFAHIFMKRVLLLALLLLLCFSSCPALSVALSLSLSPLLSLSLSFFLCPPLSATRHFHWAVIKIIYSSSGVGCWAFFCLFTAHKICVLFHFSLWMSALNIECVCHCMHAMYK